MDNPARNAKVTINEINDLVRQRLLPRSRLQRREPRAPIRDNEQDIEGRTTPPTSKAGALGWHLNPGRR